MDFSNLDLDSDSFDDMLASHDPDDDDKDSLDASDNRLTKWPKQLSRFSEGLCFLSLACNRIHEFSNERFPALSYLHLFRNSFESVDCLECSFPALLYLNLHSNPISRLPPALPPGLVYLNLSNCQLFDNPTCIWKCCLLLEVLNLSNNQLCSVDGVEALTRLTSLELQNNAIEKTPMLQGCKLLQVLNLDVFRSNNCKTIREWIDKNSF